MGNNTYEYDADGYMSKKTTVVDPTTTEVTTYQPVGWGANPSMQK